MRERRTRSSRRVPDGRAPERPVRRAGRVTALVVLVVALAAAGSLSPLHAAVTQATPDPGTPAVSPSTDATRTTGATKTPETTMATDPTKATDPTGTTGVDPKAPDPARTPAPADAPTGADPSKTGPDAKTGGGVCDDDGCGRLQPIVECSFKDPGTGLYNTVWSYRGGLIPVRLPPGFFNTFFPGAADRGQPTWFTPGHHRNVLITTHKGSLTWLLGLRTARAPGRPCGHNPVPITGAGLSSIVTLFVVGGLLGVVLVVRSRRRRSSRARA